jgi:hypothetical protein
MQVQFVIPLNSVDYKNEFSKNFNMSVGYNVTFLQNEVLEVNNGTD